VVRLNVIWTIPFTFSSIGRCWWKRVWRRSG